MWIFIIVALLCLFCFSHLLSELFSKLSVGRLYMHFAVAITFLPLSFLIASGVPYVYNNGIETLQMLLGGKAKVSQTKSSIYNSTSVGGDASTSESSSFRLANFLVPIDDQVSFLDTQAVACLLFCEYAFMIIGTHLVDIVRYLKISRRRIRANEIRKHKGIKRD